MNLWRFVRAVMAPSLGLLLLIGLIGQPVDAVVSQSLQPLFEKALAAGQEEEFPKALSLWDHFLELSPGDAAALSNRGNIRLILGDPKGAIADHTRAIELSPFQSDAYLNRGIAEEALQDWQAAESDYNRILERDPEDPLALYNLANVRSSQQNWQEAEALYKKASLSSPGFVMARIAKALMIYQLGEFDQAESELRILIRRYPMMPDARAALSALLWRQGARGEAESHWVAVAGLDIRYREPDWLLKTRRWPPQPTTDLMTFLTLESP